METFRTEEDNRRNGHDLERRATARPNTPMMRRSRHHPLGEASARPAVAKDAAFEYLELDQLHHNQEVVSNNKRNKKNKRKRLMKKNCRND